MGGFVYFDERGSAVGINAISTKASATTGEGAAAVRERVPCDAALEASALPKEEAGVGRPRNPSRMSLHRLKSARSEILAAGWHIQFGKYQRLRLTPRDLEIFDRDRLRAVSHRRWSGSFHDVADFCDKASVLLPGHRWESRYH